MSPSDPGTPLLAGLDVGSTHCKALLCTPDGTVLARAQRPTPHIWPEPGHDPTALLDAALGALTDCVRHTGRAPDAIGLTGMAETGVPLDAEGVPLGPVLSWSDPAPAAHAERLRRTLGGPALHARTGVLPSAKVPLARWSWLRERHPERMALMRVWAGAADLVAHALTGRVGTDATFAQRTMAWSPERGDWDGELLAEAGLLAEHMPNVCPPGEAVGTVTPLAARELGLHSGTPVVVAGHDHLVGAWAAGARAPGTSADSMGTAEALLTLAPSPPDRGAAAAEGMSWGRHTDGRNFFILGGMSSSGALVEWFCDRFLAVAGEGRTGTAARKDRYEAFARLVRTDSADPHTVPPPTGITVEPYLHGRSAPRPDRAARLALHGVEPRHGLPELARALLEGAAYQARWMADVQAQLIGCPPESVTLLGGSTRQHTWTALKAAVTPWRTDICAEPEAPALGAAAFSAAPLGLDPAQLHAPCRTSTPPNADADADADADPAEAHRTAYRDAFLPVVTGARG